MVEHDDLRICMLNGANTGDLGVIEGQMSYDTSESAKVRVTNLERTLIDLTVRPIYSGGVAEVLAAFEQAQPLVSVNRMRAMLQDLHYAYPYRQAIGFYLERTGYKKPQVELFSSTPQEFDFYLTHDMRQTEYVPRWRLHVPKGL
jgi:predicted transcriptional regulator of viral defense system